MIKQKPIQNTEPPAFPGLASWHLGIYAEAVDVLNIQIISD